MRGRRPLQHHTPFPVRRPLARLAVLLAREKRDDDERDGRERREEGGHDRDAVRPRQVVELLVRHPQPVGVDLDAEQDEREEHDDRWSGNNRT